MNQETNQTRKILIIVVSSIIALLVLLLIGNSIAKSVVRSKLIGKTFEGDYTYYSTDTKIEMVVEIIDEKYCNVFFDYKNLNLQKEYCNIPYKLSGGIFGVKFEWIGGYRDPVDPFEIRMKKGEIVSMVTYNFNSHHSAHLYLVRNNYQ